MNERRACCWGRGNVCRRDRQSHSVSDVTVVTPESLNRRAEVAIVLKRSTGQGHTTFTQIKCFLDGLSENEEVYGVSKALRKAPLVSSRRKHFQNSESWPWRIMLAEQGLMPPVGSPTIS